MVLLIASLLLLPGAFGRIETRGCSGFGLPGCIEGVWVPAFDPLYLVLDLAALAVGAAVIWLSRIIEKTDTNWEYAAD